MTHEWIRCSERLPKKSGNYLVTTQLSIINREVEIPFYHTHTKKWYITGEHILENVIAWTDELPEPYVGEI